MSSLWTRPTFALHFSTVPELASLAVIKMILLVSFKVLASRNTVLTHSVEAEPLCDLPEFAKLFPCVSVIITSYGCELVLNRTKRSVKIPFTYFVERMG